jgi:hypothetical protein
MLDDASRETGSGMMWWRRAKLSQLRDLIGPEAFAARLRCLIPVKRLSLGLPCR